MTGGTSDLGFQQVEDLTRRGRHPAYADWRSWTNDPFQGPVQDFQSAPVLPDRKMGLWAKLRNQKYFAAMDFVGGRLEAGSIAYAITPAFEIMQQPQALPGPPAYAQSWQIFSTELVNGTASVDSWCANSSTGRQYGIPVAYNGIFFGCWIQCVAWSGAPAVALQMLQAPFDVSEKYCVPTVGGTAAVITDTSPHEVLLTPTPAPWLRFRLVGQGSNGLTAVNMVFFMTR